MGRSCGCNQIQLHTNHLANLKAGLALVFGQNGSLSEAAFSFLETKFYVFATENFLND